MSVELIYDTAPLGTLVAWTNGEPQPPERFRSRLRAWERANAGGRLVRRCPAPISTRSSASGCTCESASYRIGCSPISTPS